MKSLLWKRLKNMRCPKCNSFLLEKTGSYHCINKCGFNIGKMEFDKVIAGIYKKRVPTVYKDNQEALNNL